jgi:hypothetical protein
LQVTSNWNKSIKSSHVVEHGIETEVQILYKLDYNRNKVCCYYLINKNMTAGRIASGFDICFQIQYWYNKLFMWTYLVGLFSVHYLESPFICFSVNKNSCSIRDDTLGTEERWRSSDHSIFKCTLYIDCLVDHEIA